MARNPSLNIIKTAVAGQVADVAGELLNYTIRVQNTGNQTLTGVVVTDPSADAGSIVRVADFAGDNDALLEVGETWSYTAAHTLTQAEIDSNGGGDGDIDNTATADSNETPIDTDDATIPVARTPKIDLEKLVSVNGAAGTFFDADTPQGPGATSASDIVFKFTVENTGNTTLTNVIIKDNKFSLDGAAGDDVLGDGGYTIASLAVGAMDTLVFDPNIFQAGQHVNTATVTTAQGATDTDLAHYYGLTPWPGVRTPGFWSQLGLSAGFWDGVIGNETKSGTNFAKGELLAFNDLNGALAGNGGNTSPYILLGDLNGDGLAGAGETTVRISLADAIKMLDPNADGANNKSFDVMRHVIAAQLNLEAGNNVGSGGSGTPLYWLKEGVEWALKFLDLNNNGVLTFTEGKTLITAASAAWASGAAGVAGNDDFRYDNTPLDGGQAFDFSGNAINSGSSILTALDQYNNTGKIGNVQFANDGDWTWV